MTNQYLEAYGNHALGNTRFTHIDKFIMGMLQRGLKAISINSRLATLKAFLPPKYSIIFVVVFYISLLM